MTITAAPKGSDNLLLLVRAAFVLHGTTLGAWCRENCVDRAHAHRVLRGITDGERARDLRHRIVKASERH